MYQNTATNVGANVGTNVETRKREAIGRASDAQVVQTRKVYVIDGATGLLMTREEYIAWDRS